jgi:glycine cleavage system H protein
MRYSESHEWIEMHRNVGTVGVTDYAQKELGDIVYVELPEVGKDVEAGDEVAVLESTKAAADIYAPVSGKIVEVNETLNQKPEEINDSPMEDGWLFKIELSNAKELDELMSKKEYMETIQ